MDQQNIFKEIKETMENGELKKLVEILNSTDESKIEEKELIELCGLAYVFVSPWYVPDQDKWDDYEIYEIILKHNPPKPSKEIYRMFDIWCSCHLSWLSHHSK